MSRVISYPFHKLLGLLMPDKSKRVLFAASLYSYLKGLTANDLPKLERFNRVLHLVKNNADLEIALYTQNSIWSGRLRTTSDQCLTPEGFNLKMEEVIRGCPSWLKYGQLEDMRKDARQVLALYYGDNDCIPA